ncbi:hypothetical protein [Planktothrix pseudagardhii]|uniref:Uncharacterized protein n=1 Tax=Planktothrix pseudagardhii TaxID=132604 RepID=A0A9W4GAJ8_9CYAN|nr:hypothetical protein [Planktothrix pseudagardhii]CAD5988461.1 hypothetical protein NO713_05714 [Planktothrix pseudagardhii]
MATGKVKRNIGIIGDGPTDRKIFAKLVDCILTEETAQEFIDCNIIELQRQTIHDAIEKYLIAEKRNSQTKNPQDLVKAVVGVLYSGFIELIYQVDLCNCDLIILTTDSELVLKSDQDYFKYGIQLFHLLSEASIKFYDSILKQSYSQNKIPLVLPIITFPSTEILIAAAKGLNPVTYYNKKPLELKQMIYNVPDDRTVSEDDLKEKALNFITLPGINNIFNHIPESRSFIQTLSAYKVSCFL